MFSNLVCWAYWNTVSVAFFCRNEAAQCPDIVVASMDCSVFSSNQDPNFTAVSHGKNLNKNEVAVNARRS